MKTPMSYGSYVLHALAWAVVGAAPVAAQGHFEVTMRERPNVVLILVDDIGVDLIGAYGEAANPPCTPNIDGIARDGLLFRNAWTNPLCSPSRAQLLTGRHGYRTGIGRIVSAYQFGLSLDETLLPAWLLGYDSMAAGKWHLATASQGRNHPMELGFGGHRGSFDNLLGPNKGRGYFSWLKTVDGQLGPTTVYATSDTADEAIYAAQTLQEPWLVYAAFNSAHGPNHRPPLSLCNAGQCPTHYCNLPPNPTSAEKVKAMVEALDTEIGRMLAGVRAVDPDAIVFFLSDNGTGSAGTEPPFLRNRAKGTLYEGGVNVPFLVSGPGIRHAEVGGLVSSTDVFATVCELAGLANPAEDSVSLVPYFTDPSLALRGTVYAERFTPEAGAPPYDYHERAIRNARYKLIRRSGERDEFYDLLNDPWEQTDLRMSLSSNAPAKAAFKALAAELKTMGLD